MNDKSKATDASGSREPDKASVNETLTSASEKPRKSRSRQGNATWILPGDGLHKAMEGLPLATLDRLMPSRLAKTSLTTKKG